jgi:Secretion system C-terminal sorting domain
LKNNGTNTITSALITYQINTAVARTFNWTGSLTRGNSINVSLPSMALPLGANAFTAIVTNPNGAADQVAANNTMTSNFTYLSAGATCANNFEVNNLASQAPTLSLNTTTYSMIQSNGDIDFFKITTTNAAPKLRLALNNLPADYDLELYAITNSGGLGRRLAVSYIGGTANEVIRYNTPTGGATYFVKITGYNGAFSNSKCYALEIAAGNTNFSGVDQNANTSNWKDAPAEITESGMIVSAFPNPVREGFTTVKVTADATDEFHIILFDMQGKEIKRLTEKLEKGENLVKMPVDAVIRGTYVIRVESTTNQSASASNKAFSKLRIE